MPQKLNGNKILWFASKHLDQKLMDFNFMEAYLVDFHLVYGF